MTNIEILENMAEAHFGEMSAAKEKRAARAFWALAWPMRYEHEINDETLQAAVVAGYGAIDGTISAIDGYPSAQERDSRAERMYSLGSPECFPSGGMKQVAVYETDDEGNEYVIGYEADDYLIWRE